MNTMLKRLISLALCCVLVTGYLPVSAFATEAEGTVNTEATEPSTEATEPSTEATEPSTEATEPSTEATEPSTEATEPSTGATEPSTEATEPSTEATEPQKVAVTGITLDQTALKVGVGELPVTLTAAVLPEDATDKTIVWTSSEPGVAAVADGVLTFGYMGEAVITATAGDFSATCTVTVGEGEWDTYESDAIVVMAASDYQKKNSDPASTLSSILDQINDDYSAADGFLFGGDYYQDSLNSASDSKAGKNAVDAAVTEAFPDVPNRVYIQGNHDPASLITDGTLSATGEHDTDNYGVYAINEDDYPWGYGASNDSFKATCQETANALDAYLDDKAEEGYTKPIFVLTHVPLHYSPRTASGHGGDGKYAKYLYTVLDEAGDKGLNIIFLFGHNHSSTYDDYLGGGQIYLAEGSTIAIAEEGSTSQYFTDTLSFTYMNCGYIGYVGGKAGTNLSMSVFEITDEEVTVKRYGTGGEVELKAAGKTTSGAPTADTTVVASGEVIELNQFEPAAAITGITVTAPTKTAYVVGDALDTAGMVVTASYDDGSTKDVTAGCEVSADLTSAGTKTVTVTYQEKTATFEITVFAPVKDETAGVTVAAPGVTGLTAAKVTEEVPEGTDYSAYVSYDITPVGYTSGEATVTVPVPESFDAGKPVMVLDGDSVLTRTTIVNGTVTFTATHFSVYSVAQTSETALTWKEIPGGTIYKLDTDGVSTGTDYLIVSTGTDGTAQALRNNNGNVASAEVTISNGQIVTSATDIVWTYDSSKYLSNGSHYVYLSYNNSTNFLSTSEQRAVAISQNNAGAGAYTVKRDGSRYSYYLNYSDGSWENAGSEDDIYFFVESGTGNGGYAAMTGTTVYNVVTGTTNAAALEAQIRSGLKVYTASDANGTNQAETKEYTLSGTCDPAVEGNYTYTVTYGGVVLDSVTVYVNDVTINGITVNPASGTVTVGASGAALVGATITADVAEGDDFTVPVTVGMLSGTFNTAVVGTYSNLTVTYGGQTFTGFTLNVREKVVNNYPSYPNEGAVKVDKKAHGIDFQKTGVAQVELTTSGIPMNQGVDVLLVLDTSSSMGMQGSLTDRDRTRIDVLKECVNALIAKLQEPRADGSESDIDIAVVHFNGYTGNKNLNYIGSTARTTSKLGGQLTDGFVDVQTLGDNWAENIPDDRSGTNYDHGFQLAYDLLSQRQSDNGDNTRKQFVLFMSDGAPFQYNGVNSNSLSSDWEKWILGSYTQAEVEALDHVRNPEFYFGNNNGQGQKHRVAEAIKGAPGNEYQIVTYSDTSSSGTTKLEKVAGLGATMYSVGLALEGTNMPTGVAGQEAILTTIASSPDLFYSVTSAAGLQSAFDDFAGAILFAAENAVFEDQMGANFNIQLASTTKRLVDGKVFTLDPAPTMEVREYTIWTRAELEDDNGNLSEENAKKVGTRKTNADGTFIYKTLEVVSFNAEGTQAYTGGDTTKNIMDANGVICAKTFWYNTSTTATVKVDVNGDGTAETDLAPETFIWKVGTIRSTELALSYYVYLDESLEGEASAGSYPTNKYAILSYDNYLGNSCQKETVSPQLAWLSANVSYAYYLVNKDGDPVNANGEKVTFADREIIVHPTKYDEIKLNNIEDVDNLQVASTGVLDDTNYKLFDYGAEYLLSVNSDATGSWEIKVGTKTDANGNTTSLPRTTYVTDFSKTVPFTNATYSNSETDNYDYTHTTVWFAVVWEPDALDDTVVIDYGLPVDVHVLTNDFFGDFGELIGVAEGTVTSDGNIQTNEIPASSDPVPGKYGSALVNKPVTGANESNSVIRYELNSMEMKEPEEFTYSVHYVNTKLPNHNGYYYGKLTVIPATTIYYEDSFVDLSSYTKTDGGWTNDGNPGKWGLVGTTANVTQDEDRPGDINFAFDTVIDANNVYGNDSAYETMSEYSLGSARKITVDKNTRGEATFTFFGTGFDVVGLTSNNTGFMTIDVFNGEDTNGTPYKTTAVDTYYGYVFKEDVDGEGEWVVSVNDPNALYQVPVMKVDKLPYDQYTVKLTAGYNEVFDHAGGEADYDLYLDAIRIYDPTGNENDTANDAYKADGEGWPSYEELRNNIIAASNYQVKENEDGTVTVTGDDLPGAIFIDCNDENTSIADYVSYGPNNELYLDNEQVIAFNVNVADNVADVQLGIKMGNGNPVTYKISAVDGNGSVTKQETITVSTTTDMYYSILDYAKAGTVTIENVSGGILSLTNIKTTHTSAPTASKDGRLGMNPQSVGNVLLSLRRSPVVEDPIPDVSEPIIPDVSEPVVPEIPEVPETKPVDVQLKEAVDAAKQLQEKDYTPATFKTLKTALKSAEKVLKNTKATEKQMEQALAKLNKAVDALEHKPDTAALKDAVSAAKKLKEKDYIPNSFKAVTTARKAAEKLLKDKNATQAKVDQALEKLNAAVAALEAKPDTSALKSAVNAVKKLKEKNYTKESFKALTTARKAAEKVMKNKNANQIMVDEALENLKAALEGLASKLPTAKAVKGNTFTEQQHDKTVISIIHQIAVALPN